MIFKEVAAGLDSVKYDSVNLYFQDEARFGLLTYVGSCLGIKGIPSVVNYQHKFDTTYLYGSYSPINGDSFVWEVNGVDTRIFEQYLEEFSKQNPTEYKIVVIDNAGFHSTKNITIPHNIYLLRIPPYSPELNPCEQIWKHIKTTYKNKVFPNMKVLKDWLHEQVNEMTAEVIKSITSNHHYYNNFITVFNI